MNLVEQIEPAAVTESGSPVHATLTGTFLRRNAKSTNGRVYPAEAVESIVHGAQRRLASPQGLPIQMLDRHATADTDESLRVVGKVTKVWMEGDNARYEAEVPNTDAGKDLATLVQGGFIRGVSLRASNPVVERGELDGSPIDVIRGADLQGIDLTLTPGIPEARIDGIQIFESVDPSRVTVLEEQAGGSSHPPAPAKQPRKAPQGPACGRGWPVDTDSTDAPVERLSAGTQEGESFLGERSSPKPPRRGSNPHGDAEERTGGEQMGASAGYARAWYETLLDAYEDGKGHALHEGHTIDYVVRQVLPLFERAQAFEKPSVSTGTALRGEYTAKDRDKIPAEDFGGPNQTFPIVTQQDVHDAARLIGHAEDPAAVKAAIIRIAQRKGFSLPDAWQDTDEKENAVADASTTEAADGVQAPPHEQDAAESAPAAPTEPKSKSAYVAEAAQALTTALREAALSDDDMEQARHLVAAADNATDQLMALFGIPDVDMTSVSAPPAASESAAVGGKAIAQTLHRSVLPRPLARGQALALEERGAAISAANRSKLSAAHDHIASALGMECAPGVGDDDMGESLSRRDVQALIREALDQQAGSFRAALRESKRSPDEPVQAQHSGAHAGRSYDAPQESQSSADVAGLLEVVKGLAESVQATQAQVREIAETLPAEAARIATETAWRPERKTHLVENRDANQPSSGERSVAEQLADRSIPVEQRMFLAAKTMEETLPEMRALAALGADIGVKAA